MYVKQFIAAIAISSASAYAAAIDVSFADSTWDGMTIPTGQQCQKFGGQDPATPAWKVTNLPVGTTAILLEYSDRDSKKMNNGGHGRMQYTLSDVGEMVLIPSVAGHSFTLPAQFTMIEAHRGAGWDIDGAYMPPCSGGKNHQYYVTISALKGADVAAKTVIEMGKF